MRNTGRLRNASNRLVTRSSIACYGGRDVPAKAVMRMLLMLFCFSGRKAWEGVSLLVFDAWIFLPGCGPRFLNLRIGMKGVREMDRCHVNRPVRLFYC